MSILSTVSGLETSEMYLLYRIFPKKSFWVCHNVVPEVVITYVKGLRIVG